MFEDLPKLVELGALGLISFYLIFQGIGKMQQLTASIKDLTGNLETLTKSINNLQTKTEVFEHRFEIIENRLNNVENHFKNLEDLIRAELRDIKFDLEHHSRDRGDRD
jgi:predicted  nucleic acid-binding Zn-ribbon protein